MSIPLIVIGTMSASVGFFLVGKLPSPSISNKEWKQYSSNVKYAYQTVMGGLYAMSGVGIATLVFN